MAILNFNAADVEPADNDFTPLPVGDYKMVVTESELKETKSNPNNKYLKFTFEVIDGKYKGRKVFENMNIVRAGNSDKDKTTMRIAQQNLSSLCRAVGKMSISDTCELQHIPILVTLKIRPASGDYGESNAVAKYASINGGSTLTTQAPQAPAAPTKPPAMPWDKD
jgi:hypothetical protein